MQENAISKEDPYNDYKSFTIILLFPTLYKKDICEKRRLTNLFQ